MYLYNQNLGLHIWPRAAKVPCAVLVQEPANDHNTSLSWEIVCVCLVSNLYVYSLVGTSLVWLAQARKYVSSRSIGGLT